MRMPWKSASRPGGKSQSFWVCYSDLMSALLLVFVLIMFYSVYLYYDMLEVKTAELLRQSGLLDEKESALTSAQSELDEKSLKLTETENQLLTEKAKLLLQEQTLASLQAKLDEQESALSSARVTLDEALVAYNSAKDQLDAQQVKLDKLVGVRTEIIDELIGELSKANITGAKVDESGAIVFDSEMMFDVNMSSLKDVGRSFLKSFIPNYLKVLMSDQYSKYVSQIIIEGHTDSDGTYLANMQLSQARAYAVLNYLISADFTDITDAEKTKLRQIVTVNGRADSDPVLTAAGAEDKDASRRVVIKFRLNDEDMVDEMLAILENMDAGA